MIKIENVHVGGFEAAIRGMRNPMNSWEKSDTMFLDYAEDDCVVVCHDISGVTHRIIPEDWLDKLYDGVRIGPNDMKLMKSLVAGGPVHAKFRRFIDVSMDLTAPFYWWNDFDTYRIGRFDNFYGHDIEYDSCSTMHKIHAKEFTLEDFSTEHLFDWNLDEIKNIIRTLNRVRDLYLDEKDKDVWYQMIQLLPNSYNQKRTVKLNYEVLAGLYPMRKDHKLDEFRDFCKWIETLPYAKELIIGQAVEDLPTSPLLDPKYNGGE